MNVRRLSGHKKHQIYQNSSGGSNHAMNHTFPSLRS